MEEYDETKNYKMLHLEWIKTNRTFRPKTGIPIGYFSYLEYMSELYDSTIKNQRTAYIYLKDDYKWSKRSKSINEEVAIMFGDKPDNTANTFFVTFNFCPTKFNPLDAVKFVNRIYDKSWVTSAYGVFENYTENGNHPHFMMRIVVDKYNKKGKLLDKMLESSLAKLTSGRNFIDVKPYLKCHDDYLLLDKAVEKKKYLDMDIVWRKENNLPEYLEKK